MSASIGFNAAQNRALAALLAGADQEKTATSARKSVRTIQRWLRDERFRSELASRSRAVLDDAQQVLQRSAVDAARTLADTASGKITANAARCSAARSVLELARGASELDELEEMVVELAGKLEARKGFTQ